MRSELEHVVLALVWLRQPCTAYLIRREFDRSISSHWSSSAGSIYPLLQRLTRAGLLKGRSAKTGRRASRLIQLTPRGDRVLTAWLTSAAPAFGDAIGHDPLRTRLRFLARLSPAAGHKVVQESRQAVRLALRTLSELPQPADEFERLSHRNAELTLQARLSWLSEVDTALRRRPSRRASRPSPSPERPPA